MERLISLVKNEVVQILAVIMIILIGTIKFIIAYVPEKPDGQTINAQLVHNDALTEKNIVNLALTLQGKKYSPGGKGPNAFDCSGFTRYVFKQFDIKLPPTTGLQYKRGKPITQNEIKPGDLLFFKITSDRASHVGIATSNKNGKVSFIHSATHSGITIDSLSHRYYQPRYLGARRIIDN